VWRARATARACTRLSLAAHAAVRAGLTGWADAARARRRCRRAWQGAARRRALAIAVGAAEAWHTLAGRRASGWRRAGRALAAACVRRVRASVRAWSAAAQRRHGLRRSALAAVVAARRAALRRAAAGWREAARRAARVWRGVQAGEERGRRRVLGGPLGLWAWAARRRWLLAHAQVSHGSMGWMEIPAEWGLRLLSSKAPR
jgi:hypothetical protein